jgi:hypothetical protein
MTLEDIWRGHPIATRSTVFRTGLREMPPSCDDVPKPVTDWPLNVLKAECGLIGYIDRVMSVYRIHESGSYSQLSEMAKFEKRYQFYMLMNRNMKYRCDAVARNGFFYYFLEWAEAFKMRGEWESVKFCSRKCLTRLPIGRAACKRLLRVLNWLLWRSAGETLLPAGP